MIIEYLNRHTTATSEDIAELLALKPTRTKVILSKMVTEEVLSAKCGNKNRTYKLSDNR